MKKQIFKNVFGLTVMFTMLLGLMTNNAEASGTMCKTYGYYDAGSQTFVCDGAGSTVCWYRCAGGNQQ